LTNPIEHYLFWIAQMLKRIKPLSAVKTIINIEHNEYLSIYKNAKRLTILRTETGFRLNHSGINTIIKLR